jgi:hypothetical protein
MPTAPTAAVCSTARRLRLVFRKSVMAILLEDKTESKKGVLTVRRACGKPRAGGDAFVRV